MKKYLALIIFSILFNNLPAQENRTDITPGTFKRNTVYLELLGQGGAYSLGYDCVFWSDIKRKCTFSVGLSIVPSNPNLFYDGINHKLFSLPLSLNLVRFRYLELGIGLTPVFVSERQMMHSPGVSWYANEDSYSGAVFLTPKIGFRYQKSNGGAFFRASFIQLIQISNQYYFYNLLPWAGMSVGWTF